MSVSVFGPIETTRLSRAIVGGVGDGGDALMADHEVSGGLLIPGACVECTVSTYDLLASSPEASSGSRPGTLAEHRPAA